MAGQPHLPHSWPPGHEPVDSTTHTSRMVRVDLIGRIVLKLRCRQGEYVEHMLRHFGGFYIDKAEHMGFERTYA